MIFFQPFQFGPRTGEGILASQTTLDVNVFGPYG